LTLSLSRAAARRFLVARHGLAPPRALPAQPESVLRVVERLGVLQFDPLEVPGARNHDLVLHARIDGYRREWCDLWLYGPDRRLFEIYNKSLNIVPIEELPHYRLTWARNAERYTDRPDVAASHAPIVMLIGDSSRFSFGAACPRAIPAASMMSIVGSRPRWIDQLHPLVEPQVLHFRQVPLRTSVKLPQSWHGSPSYPFILASKTICTVLCSSRTARA